MEVASTLPNEPVDVKLELTFPVAVIFPDISKSSLNDIVWAEAPADSKLEA